MRHVSLRVAEILCYLGLKDPLYGFYYIVDRNYSVGFHTTTLMEYDPDDDLYHSISASFDIRMSPRSVVYAPKIDFDLLQFISSKLTGIELGWISENKMIVTLDDKRSINMDLTDDNLYFILSLLEFNKLR